MAALHSLQKISSKVGFLQRKSAVRPEVESQYVLESQVLQVENPTN